MNEEYAFKVARIEPENNIHLVLEAFSKIDYTLIIVGNWDNSTYGKELKARYATYKNIFILDPIYDQDQLDLLRSNAAIYIHGHSAGGTNPSLVEAMGLSLPIICYNVSYNRATTENQCFYFSTAQELCEIVNTTSFESLTQCSISMKRIAERRYTWQVIARQYAQLVYQVKEQTKKIPLTPRMSRIKPKDLLTGELGHMTSTMPYYEERF